MWKIIAGAQFHRMASGKHLVGRGRTPPKASSSAAAQSPYFERVFGKGIDPCWRGIAKLKEPQEVRLKRKTGPNARDPGQYRTRPPGWKEVSGAVVSYTHRDAENPPSVKTAESSAVPPCQRANCFPWSDGGD
jgi:hypothetical protein